MTFVESYRRSARDRDINLETNLSDLAYDTSDAEWVKIVEERLILIIFFFVQSSEYECLFSEEIHKRRESWKVRQRFVLNKKRWLLRDLTFYFTRSISSLPTYILPYNEQLKLTRAMNSSRPSFVSHVDGMDDTDGAEDLSNLATARLLPGEKEVQSADNVCLYSSKTGGWVDGFSNDFIGTKLSLNNLNSSGKKTIVTIKIITVRLVKQWKGLRSLLLMLDQVYRVLEC